MKLRVINKRLHQIPIIPARLPSGETRMLCGVLHSPNVLEEYHGGKLGFRREPIVQSVGKSG